MIFVEKHAPQQNIEKRRTIKNKSLENSWRRNVIFASVFPIIFGVLSGCWMPAQKDDFSVLGSDPFSNILRTSGYDRADVNLGRNIGASMIDPKKVKHFSIDLFMGKSVEEITGLFSKNDGRCYFLSDAEKKSLICNVKRK